MDLSVHNYITEGMMSDKLGMGAVFPRIVLDAADGGRLELPKQLDGRYGVVLFYRGHW